MHDVHGRLPRIAPTQIEAANALHGRVERFLAHLPDGQQISVVFSRLVVLVVLALLLCAPLAVAHPHHGPAPAVTAEDLAARAAATVASGLQAPADEGGPGLGHIEELGYPLPPDPTERFAGFVVREELASAGELEGAFRVMRYSQVTDLQLVDDDAPYPMRQALLDDVFAATISGGAWRPQEEYSDEILHSMVDVLNAHHFMDKLDFIIHTGDQIDNALENELMRYIDILRGTHTTTGPLSGFPCVPDGQSEYPGDTSNNVEDQCTSLPEHLVPELRGLADDLPWYSVYGNHDGLIQGNVNILPSFQEIAAEHGRYFIRGSEYVAMHFEDLQSCGGGSIRDDFGHGYGFAGDRLCDDDPDNDAYYAFTHRGIRKIVLDTVNHEVTRSHATLGPLIPPSSTTGHSYASGLSEGAISATQFAWLVGELEAHQDVPVILYAHHTPDAFYSRQFDAACGPPGCLNDVLRMAGMLGREDMEELLLEYPNVFAFIGGHTHKHQVTPVLGSGTPSPGYWNIETSGLLDLPQESRIIEWWVTADGGKGFVALDPIGHTFELARELAATDDQHDGAAAAGGPGDQRVLLWFDIPAGIALEAGPQPPLEAPVGVLNLVVTVDPSRPDEPGSVTVTASLTDRATGTTVVGLDVFLRQVSHRDPGGNTTIIDDAGTRMAMATGGYRVEVELEEAGVHSFRVDARDPAGYFAAASTSMEIEVGEPEATKRWIPQPALIVVITLLGLAVLWRRQP